MTLCLFCLPIILLKAYIIPMMIRWPIIIALILTALASPAAGTKYAGEPFSLGVGAGPLGMGGAVIAGPFDAASGYWNPAGLALLSGRQVQTMHAETFGSLLNHDYIGLGVNNGRVRGLNAFGFYLYYLGGGGVKITAYDEASRYPYVIREESHFDLLAGGSLAGRFGENLAVGVTGKIIYRDITTETAYGLGLDAGAVYLVDTLFTVALTVTDLTSTFLAYSNDVTETIYPAVKPAAAFRLARYDMVAYLTGQAIIRFEGRQQNAELWQGEVSADFQCGLQIGYKGVAFGRLGLDQDRFTAGLGAVLDRYLIDMAYLHHADLDETLRISAGINF